MFGEHGTRGLGTRRARRPEILEFLRHVGEHGLVGTELSVCLKFEGRPLPVRPTYADVAEALLERLRFYEMMAREYNPDRADLPEMSVEGDFDAPETIVPAFELKRFHETERHAKSLRLTLRAGTDERVGTPGASVNATLPGDVDGYLRYESDRWDVRARQLRQELGEDFITGTVDREARLSRMVYKFKRQGRLPSDWKLPRS